jgi:type I restriction enzyme R subunit
VNDILTEKEYQHYIMDELVKHGYVIRNAKTDYDRAFAMDRGILFKFLQNTQPEAMDALTKIYKDKTEDTVISFLNAEMTKERGSLLNVLKNGVEISNQKLNLLYRKPATTFNKEANRLYNENIFSVMEEVVISDKERIDLVIFFNGLAVISMELKCNHAKQSYHDAITQYRTERDPKNRLFRFKAGCLVNFAMDLDEVYMATKLDGESTFFLPFNMGNGTGIEAGAGNPIFKDKYSVSYMWEDILTKDTLVELITQFVFIDRTEEKDENTSRKKIKEKLIFPRFHQLDVIRKLLADIYVNKSSLNYLIQHSAGSGKTNSIAWLAHRLTSLHDADQKIIFDKIIIVTDRVVVDRQLQKAVTGMEHKSGLIRVMDEKCTSADLADALSGNTKIIATTIQKFPYIVDNVKNMQNRTFAVIIDEAHSSTSGKDMAAVTKALSAGEDEDMDVEDMLVYEIRRSGKQNNVSIFAFTATPKATTLQQFGRLNDKGQYQAFHVYSMKQAIEEGFILDVLQNYVEYNTFYHINKKILDDPEMKTSDAKRQIARFIKLHETNIAQRIEIIIEHFRTTVMNELGGKAKAMVITSSREEAVKYKLAFEDYIKRKNYNDIKALVAFSGKLKLKNDDTEYSEAMMNGFSEDKLTREFDKDDYQVLLVANKYQTGFDQPKLCAMYVLKKLKNVAAVQTLSRLNRICPPYTKKTFILDFVNSCEDMEKAFAPYYTTTLLSNTVTPQTIYELEAKVDGFYVVDPADIEDFSQLLYSGEITSKIKTRLNFLLNKSVKQLEKYDVPKQREFITNVRHFIRFYEFLIQVTCFEDVELHKKYVYLTHLEARLNIGDKGGGYNLDGKLQATNFVQKKEKETKNTKITGAPVVKLPVPGDGSITEAAKEKLSQIIEEINSKMGTKFDTDVAVKSMLQIKDLMMKSDSLKTSAKNNTEADFKDSFYSNVDDALIDGLEQNQDFYTLLLNNDEVKRNVLDIFVPEIYNMMRKEQQTQEL